MSAFTFLNRDISWLSFNERVLAEAGKPSVPLLERIRFLSIYSSNLDEFYRVRVPAMLALEKVQKEKWIYEQVTDIVNSQLHYFGTILTGAILPALEERGFHLVYNESIPSGLLPFVNNYFFTQVAGFIQLVRLEDKVEFFPENNQLYIAVVVLYDGVEKLFLVNIPVNNLSRFLKTKLSGTAYIVFLEDIIKSNLSHLFPSGSVEGAYNLKITRDAALDLQDEYAEDLAEKLEKQLSKRDEGLATRLLYEPGLPLRHLQQIIKTFHLEKASIVEGGRHHHLKDLAQIPFTGSDITYEAWPPYDSLRNVLSANTTLFKAICSRDIIIHVPYQSYDPVLRFFNEAAIDETVTEIYTTLYRVASDSRIAYALISAARNGKKVSVLVELKARFDEANNIRWAKRMKAEGVRIIYSNNALKVHAKIALVKREDKAFPYLGLLATGNLNETTARFYTDHILLTAHQSMLAEMEKLFLFLRKRKKPDPEDAINFKHLLVAQFNLPDRFSGLIERETKYARTGREASIIIKMNNLEEEGLITKLYEASNAGVKIQLMVRGICRLVPGIKGQSENIHITRIVDRYLEHGRVFIFQNDGNQEIYMGSADWMNRNIYRRIEVCFPLYDPSIREEIMSIIEWQLKDNVQAVAVNDSPENKSAESQGTVIRSQEAIYHFLEKKMLKDKPGSVVTG